MIIPRLELISFLQSLRPRYKLATLSNDWPGAQQVGMKAILFNDTDQVVAEVQACLNASESCGTSNS